MLSRDERVGARFPYLAGAVLSRLYASFKPFDGLLAIGANAVNSDWSKVAIDTLPAW
jgi:hypothetical protein